jgi:hypothetical protein
LEGRPLRASMRRGDRLTPVLSFSFSPVTSHLPIYSGMMFLRETKEGLLLTVRVIPRSARDEIVGTHGDALRTHRNRDLVSTTPEVPRPPAAKRGRLGDATLVRSDQDSPCPPRPPCDSLSILSPAPKLGNRPCPRRRARPRFMGFCAASYLGKLQHFLSSSDIKA